LVLAAHVLRMLLFLALCGASMTSDTLCNTLQVVIDKLEPSYVLLRNPLLPSITEQQGHQQQQQQQQGAAEASSKPGDSAAGQFDQLHACKLVGVSGEDDDMIHARAQVHEKR
jgi:hypothetical protein